MAAPVKPAVTTSIQKSLTYFLVVAMYFNPWMVDDSRKVANPFILEMIEQRAVHM